MKRFTFTIFNKKLPMLSLFFLLLATITFLTTIIFIILDIINITSFIKLSKNYDWLGFFGGFLGGLFGGVATFLGVYITLDYQRTSENEKNRLSLIPIFEYRLSYDKSDFDNSNGQLAGESFSHINIGEASYQDKNVLEWYFNLIITNVGVGHGQIKEIKFIIGDDHERFIQEENLGYSYKLLKKDKELSLKYLIYAPANEETDKNLYTLKLIIKYQDLLGNKYNQLLHSSIAGSVKKDDKHQARSNNAHLHFYENFELIRKV